MSTNTLPPDVTNNIADDESPAMRQLRCEYTELGLKCLELKQQIDSLREELAQTEESQADILQQIRLIADAPMSITEVDGLVTADAKPKFDPNFEHWRNAPITELELAAIVGLGRHKRAKLIEAVPTLGDLEDLRCKASKEFLELCTLLPKGIGHNTTNELEERFLNWLQRNRGSYGIDRDGSEFEGSIPHMDPPNITPAIDDVLDDIAQDAEAKSVAESRPAAEVPPIDAARVIELPPAVDPVSSIKLFDIDSPEQVRTRYDELLQKFRGNEFDPAWVTNQETFQDGREAAGRSWSLADCNWIAGTQQDDWLLGFISAGGVPDVVEVSVTSDEQLAS